MVVWPQQGEGDKPFCGGHHPKLPLFLRRPLPPNKSIIYHRCLPFVPSLYWYCSSLSIILQPAFPIIILPAVQSKHTAHKRYCNIYIEWILLYSICIFVHTWIQVVQEKLHFLHNILHPCAPAPFCGHLQEIYNKTQFFLYIVYKWESKPKFLTIKT